MVSLFVTLMLLFWSASGMADSTPNGRFHWVSDDPKMGGMSAIEMADDGASFVAVSDRGFILRATVTRDADGAIVGITHSPAADIKTAKALRTHWTTEDSEGLAVAPDGTIYVSFEGTHRVAMFSDLAAPEVTLPLHPEFADLQANSSLEALAIDADGALYTMPERSGRFDRPFPIYRFRDGVWDTPFALPRVGSFLVVGADFGPDGMLYVLERDFTGFSFLNRVRRVDLNQGTSETVVLGGGQFGNLEGISVWTAHDGATMVSMIADDNYNVLLQTEIVEYRIAP